MGSNFLFDEELWFGSVAGVGDFYINEASDRIVVGVVPLSWTEIVFKIACLGYRRVRGIGVSTPLLRITE